MQALVALLVALATMAAAGQAPAIGEIAGRITDSQGEAVPGVRITISRGDELLETVTDREGAFQVGGLGLGAYRVTTALSVFRPVSGIIALSPDVRRAYVTWSLEIGCLSEVAWVVLPVRDAAATAHAIARVRVRSDNGQVLGAARPDCDGWTRRAYTVDVVQSVPGRGRKDDGRTTFEILLSPPDAPLTVGEEYLALLWHSGRVTGASAFAIVSGRIASSAAGVGELNGMRAEEAWETLLGWSRQQKP